MAVVAVIATVAFVSWKFREDAGGEDAGGWQMGRIYDNPSAEEQAEILHNMIEEEMEAIRRENPGISEDAIKRIQDSASSITGEK